MLKRVGILSFLLLLFGCSTNQVITSLQAALDAIALGLPVLAAADPKIPAADVALALTYDTQANQALGQSASILAGPGTDAQKSVEVFALFAAIVKPDIPSQYSALVDIVATVAGDVAQFLATLPAASAATAKTARAARTTKLSSGDLAKLKHAEAVSLSNAATLGGMRR